MDYSIWILLIWVLHFQRLSIFKLGLLGLKFQLFWIQVGFLEFIFALGFSDFQPSILLVLVSSAWTLLVRWSNLFNLVSTVTVGVLFQNGFKDCIHLMLYAGILINYGFSALRVKFFPIRLMVSISMHS